ncbi:MAG: glutamyl-tRNA synthetase, partial [Deltaproteobacteria bacterium]|nr:glutamyl-tRNA synthetase [Deltaproteobacteria bacterium]
TGLLHVGNARTALFNYLFARQTGGTFILRLEDTDTARSTIEAEKATLQDLRWLGLPWDEGPEQPGNFGPYRQSERLEIYRKYAQVLRDKGKAYRCYCTEEELEEKRKRFLAKGIPPKYDGRCRNLAPEEEKSFIENGRRASLRFRVEARHITFEDQVKGRMSFDGQGLGDFIILRSDRTASYNFAAVIDDHLMEVSHVIRGEDHLTNTPRQILVYQALGFPPPRFAHLSLILGPDRTPLSKRHGATAVSHFREEGYLPQALANYLALLGWSPEDGRELLKLEELVRKFSLKRVSRSAAVFDFEKLNWVNREHLKGISGEKALEACRPFLKRFGLPLEEKDPRWWQEAVAAVWGEVDFLAQLPERLQVFFDAGFRLSPEAESLFAKEENRQVVVAMAEEIEKVPEVTAENYRQLTSAVGSKLHLSGKALFMPLRAALTGKIRGPELEKVFILLGKEKVSRRLRAIPPRSA